MAKAYTYITHTPTMTIFFMAWKFPHARSWSILFPTTYCYDFYHRWSFSYSGTSHNSYTACSLVCGLFSLSIFLKLIYIAACWFILLYFGAYSIVWILPQCVDPFSWAVFSFSCYAYSCVSLCETYIPFLLDKY